jgi:hypothetical protein
MLMYLMQLCAMTQNNYRQFLLLCHQPWSTMQYNGRQFPFLYALPGQSHVPCLRYFLRSFTVYKVCSCMPGDSIGHVITTRENLSRFVESVLYLLIYIYVRSYAIVYTYLCLAFLLTCMPCDIFGNCNTPGVTITKT